ncbi:hypothetical protein ZIOFF_031817 [Zingiber officinale]|uniref:Uncharacterized protein n=1 Tax=Zingiber officinale TaxID=94328 RepID=A0A8J5GMK5_ZINOF|nr:hypothetical protein ZIOFF_031817 [Zingiber officinale]
MGTEVLCPKTASSAALPPFGAPGYNPCLGDHPPTRKVAAAYTTQKGQRCHRLGPAMFTAECLGPDLTLIPKHIRLKPLTEEAWDKYAGLVIDLSLSPRALPLLSFSRTKHTPTAANFSAMKDQSPEAIAPAGMKISREIHYYVPLVYYFLHLCP